MPKIKINIIVLVFISLILFACNSDKMKIESNEKSDWIIAELLEKKSADILINGYPKLVNSPYGQAVYFNGEDDALFLNQIPLKNAKSFTIEMIFNPIEINPPFEQRIVHIGEVSKDRVLLEIRAKNNNWYFDGFVASKNNDKALIDEELMHPLGKWYHVALVVSPNSISTYVNGKKELQEPFSFKPITSGKTSLGVRLNKKSWFKGSIYKVKITSKVLDPENFISIKELVQ